jgi:RimK family alpha-L-glutamate ligase
MTVGIAVNPYAPNVAKRLAASAATQGIAHRLIDLPTVALDIEAGGTARVTDRAGEIVVTCLAPYLLFGFPAAVAAFRVLQGRAYAQNPVDAVLTADDKAATAVALAGAGVPQVPTRICPQDPALLHAAAVQLGYPVVVKRTHGAQGRWVRRAADRAELVGAYAEFEAEGPGALILQPYIAQAAGSSVRAIVTGGRLLASSRRTATQPEWRSNIARGGSQVPVELSPAQRRVVLAATGVLRLGHAGVDLLPTPGGTVVLEVNSCPDFTSMLPHVDRDLAGQVLAASAG